MVSLTEVNSWYIGKEITLPLMTGIRITYWIDKLDKYRHNVKEILEIGSCEGQSTIFWLNFFPFSEITCIDHFQVYFTEGTFDKNTAEFGDKVHKIRQDSLEALPELVKTGRKFDFIYIDASHGTYETAIESAESWAMLNKGGIIIWDDYEFGVSNMSAPVKQAVDPFIKSHEGELDIFFELISTAEEKPYSVQLGIIKR
jgi:predicted O-methyltransferase YrrM